MIEIECIALSDSASESLDMTLEARVVRGDLIAMFEFVITLPPSEESRVVKMLEDAARAGSGKADLALCYHFLLIDPKRASDHYLRVSKTFEDELTSSHQAIADQHQKAISSSHFTARRRRRVMRSIDCQLSRVNWPLRARQWLRQRRGRLHLARNSKGSGGQQKRVNWR
jgi:hypothetical protein